ncbi:MAG TPA: LysR substrate-binding domain-containing protein [Burkholderiaceae bacterium]|nr:LysR substrate-binding domain-containing protein [Burkholderiaceae bacterium]
MNLTLKQLRAFVAVADTGNFTSAAQQLHVTASALSLTIKELESAVGTRLFERTTRQVHLAPAGRDFLPSARKLVDDLARAVEGIRDFQASTRGVLRIAGSPTYAGTLVPQLALEFRRLHPGVKVLVIDVLTDQVAARVASGEADLGIAPERPVPREVIQTQLFRDPLQLVCRPDHPLAMQEPVQWSEVLRHPFISLAPDYAASMRADLAFHSESLTLEPAAYVTFITTALALAALPAAAAALEKIAPAAPGGGWDQSARAMQGALVKAGEGITVQPSAAEPLAAAYGLVVKTLREPLIQRRICLIRPRERESSPSAERFCEFVEARFGVRMPPG